ncbi:putative porin [Flagellimonas sp.]|uniref:putative porin n=1 Tax=Flagellimonas sp. TaxID=2058762 RepID=UPI003BAEA287
MTKAHQTLLPKNYLFVFLLISSTLVIAQSDSTKSKFRFNGDFRFRVEQDWDSRKSDGSYREDRSRLRYRLRAGLDYHLNPKILVGTRIRTGDPKKQQDPQLTLGDGFNEFGTLPIALEKAFFQLNLGTFEMWLGKNTFSFKKQNELFWSDNVYPEGLHIQKTFNPKLNWVDHLNINAGHFILNTRGGSFVEDSYFQGIQLVSQHFDNRFAVWPSLYLFRNIQDIPDGAETFFLDYSIASVGGYVKLSRSPLVQLEMDWYLNLEDYSTNDSIPEDLQNQKSGVTLAANYGQLTKKGDWLVKLTYTYLERFSALDFMAQNDWARWDYSSFGSPDGRLTNLEGIEFTLGTKIEDKIALKMKYYWVDQLVPLGTFKENGQRIRFDIDIKI